MATNVQINNLQENGQYEIIYPQTSCENIIDLSTNYYNKTETLQNNVAQLIGLSSGALPNDMFNVLSTIGDLYVWKRTQNGEVDYPVSVNPNAYQEGSDAQPAGYTLGPVQSGQFILTNKLNSSQSTHFKQGEYEVSEDGTLSLPSENSIDFYGYESELANVQKLLGKKTILSGQSVGSFTLNSAYYFPDDAVITHEGGSGNRGYWVIDRYQPVTGYPAIPAETTIEYMGQLGDKERIETGSYVGTGTYGASNPNSLTFGFPVKIIVITGFKASNQISSFFGSGNTVIYTDYLSTDYKNYTGPYIVGADSYHSYCKKSQDEKTVQWYYNESSALYQLNGSGYTYYYFAMG